MNVVPAVWRMVMLIMLGLVLSCSGSGTGGTGGNAVSATVRLSGSVVASAPVVNTAMALRDSTGKIVSLKTGPTGTFDAILGLKLPIISRAPDPTTGQFMYSYTDTAGNTNIHPLTDAILRIWYAVKHPGGNIDEDFIASAPSSLPTLDEIAFIRAVVTMVVRDLLNAVLTGGATADTFDLIKTPYAGLGFDTLLAGLRVTTGSDGSLHISVVPGSALGLAIAGKGISNTSSLNGGTLSFGPDTTNPAPPTGVVPVSVCSARVLVTWLPSASADTAVYKVFEQTAGELATVTSTAYILSNPVSGATYTFMVTAIDASGNSSLPSTPASVTLNNSCATPPPVTPLGTPPTVTALSSNEIKIAWTASGGPDIEYAVYSAEASTVVGAVPIARTLVKEFVDSGLSPGTLYCYAVTYSHTSGESPKTNPSVCLTTPPGIPRAPKNVQASAGSGSMTVSWSAAGGALFYNVYMASVPGITKVNYKSLAGGALHSVVTTTNHAVTGLTTGKTYYSVVTAVSPSGESAESVQVQQEIL